MFIAVSFDVDNDDDDDEWTGEVNTEGDFFNICIQSYYFDDDFQEIQLWHFYIDHKLASKSHSTLIFLKTIILF